MARPPGIDQNDYEAILQRITAYLQRGCSIAEACTQCQIPFRAVYDKCQRDKAFSARIKALQDTPVVLARKVWVSKIEDGDYIASRDYLRAKRKDEFSEAKVVGGRLEIGLADFLKGDSKKEESNDEEI